MPYFVFGSGGLFGKMTRPADGENNTPESGKIRRGTGSGDGVRRRNICIAGRRV